MNKAEMWCMNRAYFNYTVDLFYATIPSKKKGFSSPPALFFSAASLFYYYYYYFFYEQRYVFMSKNQQASLVKPIAAAYTPK